MDCSVELYQSIFDVPCWLRHVLIWLHLEQAIVAGIVAAIVASITVFFIRRQIDQVERHRKDDIKRTHVAHRIEAIWAMMLVAEYAELCLEFIIKTDAQEETLKYVKEVSDDAPNFPINTLATISKLAYGLDPYSAEKIRAFVGHAQIQHARLKLLKIEISGNQTTPNGSPITGHLNALLEAKLDFFILKFQCNQVLGYCRGEFDEIPDLQDTSKFISDASFGYFNLTEVDKSNLSNHWPKNGWVDVLNV